MHMVTLHTCMKETEKKSEGEDKWVNLRGNEKETAEKKEREI